MKIVAFGHRKNTGKDTAGRFLASLYRQNYPGSNVIKKGFAEKIYDICHDLYSWAGFKSYQYYQEHPESKQELLPKIGLTVREILIKFGTNAVRDQVYDKTWTKYLLETYKEMFKNKDDLLIITDFRFKVEAQEIGNYSSSFLVKVERPSVVDTHDIADDNLNCFCGWDYIINNNSDLLNLYKQVEQFYNQFLKSVSN